MARDVESPWLVRCVRPGMPLSTVMPALALWVGLVSPAPVAPPTAAASAADREPVELLPPKTAEPNWQMGAFVDVAYGFSSNRPDNRLFRGQLTTPRTGEFTIGNVGAYAEHTATETEPWRVELALSAGAATDAIYAGEPRPGGDAAAFSGPEVFKHIARANAGALIRRSKTEIRGGLLGSPLGIGSAWTRNDWNYTTSWGANAAPYYLMGVQVIQALPRDFGVEAWVVNGWQTIADVNAAPSYLVGVFRERGAWHARSQVYFGPEGADLAPQGWRVLWDTIVRYDGPRWGVAGVADLGQDRLTELPGQPQHLWVGAAGFVHGIVWQNEYTVLDIAARPEIFWDRDGLMFGVPQILVGETVTFSARLWDHLLVRLEYRYDRSTAANGFFYRQQATDPADVLAPQQHTIFGSIVGYIDRPVRLGKRRP